MNHTSKCEKTQRATRDDLEMLGVLGICGPNSIGQAILVQFSPILHGKMQISRASLQQSQPSPEVVGEPMANVTFYLARKDWHCFVFSVFTVL